jgi:hypothetical protein
MTQLLPLLLLLLLLKINMPHQVLSTGRTDTTRTQLRQQ